MSKPKYSIVIPCHNESLTVEETVRNLFSVIGKEADYEIVLIDNLSTDETWAVLLRLAKQFEAVKCFKSPQRAGYGVAIRAGMHFSTGSHVVFVMADGSEHPADVLSFILTSISNPEACVFGNRFSQKGSVKGYPSIKWMVNRVANFTLGLLFKSKSRDLTNGFKLYPRHLLDSLTLEADDFSITIELSLGAICAGAEIVEIPNKWRGREAGESSFNLLKLAIPYLRSAVSVARRCKVNRRGP